MGINHALREDLLEEDYQYRKLHSVHEELEDEIKKATSLPLVDTQKIKFLKKKKLMVADQMDVLAQKS